MRSMTLMVALLVASPAALPMLAQDAPGKWSVDIHSCSPTLTGNYHGTQNGQAVNFDLVNDLGLAKNGSTPGASLEYQGPRFGLELSMDTQKYDGDHTVTEPVVISGQKFNAQARLVTDLKLTTTTFNWTIRALKFTNAWVGIDLGVRSTQLDLNAVGTNYLAGQSVPVTFKSPLPMPQVGLSVGFHVLEERLIVKGYYHYLGYKGATYYHSGVDVRFFPLRWLGLRAFTDTENWKIPNNSLASDLQVGLNRSGTGFGVVFRF